MQEINRDFLTLSFGTTADAIKKDKPNRNAPTCFDALKRIVYIALTAMGELSANGDNKFAKYV
jgi:hypothetical protein